MLRSVSIVALLLLSTITQAAENAAELDGVAKIEAELQRKTEVQYLDTQLVDVITDLQLRHHIQIQGDWAAISAAVEQPGDAFAVTCSMKDVPLASVLAHMLTPHKLTYAIANDVLLLTSLEQEAKYVSTKVYKVGDFATDLAVLQQAIESTIETPSWRTNGGQVGAIARYEDTKSLIVTHTSRTQQRVGKLIDDLRATKQDVSK